MSDILPLTGDLVLAWTEFVRTTAGSSPYHLPDWWKVFAEGLGYAFHGLAQVKDGGIVAGLPLYQVPGFVTGRLAGPPFRDRGGILAAPGVDVAPLVAAAARQAAGRPLCLRQEQPLSPALVREFGLHEDGGWLTTRVDLTAGSKALWEKLGNNASGPVRQASRQGVAVRPGRDIRDMRLFYDIFVRCRRRLGSPCFPWRFFRSLWDNLSGSGAARLLLAEHEGLAVAGMILLVHKTRVIDGYAASLPGSERLRANDLLVWSALEWAAGNGFSDFDFGADSPGQIGLLAFKRKWLGGNVPMYAYHLGPGTGKRPDASRGVYRLAAAVIRRTPLPLYKTASRLLVSRLG
jgi:hypothetical protein